MSSPPQASSSRKRVAILGGGPAALTAAFELTATPELAARHEITIYQPGWRLGGKCASGRNPDHHERIEEHGLHVWFGCYDNAFSIVRRCYEELGRDPETDALATWRDAFKPCDQVVVWEMDDDERWSPHALTFPPNDDEPGIERRRDLPDVLREVARWMDRRLWELTNERPAVAEAVAFADDPHDGEGRPLETLVADARLPYLLDGHASPTHMLDAALELADRHLANAMTGALDAADDLRRYARAVRSFRDWLHEQVVAGVPGDPELRFYARTVDLATAAMKGILVDWLPLRGYDAINHRDLGDWLAEHGAEIDRVDPQRNSAFLRGVYCGSFAFVEGDPKRPNMAAGRALQGAIRCLFHYNGSVLWRMQAGMGDAIIAPLYRVLEQRGVRFAFFHAAEAVVPSADGTRVERIDLVRQVAVRGEYRPLITVPHDGRPLECWPDRPRFGQLREGGSDRVRSADFEHEIDPLGDGARLRLVAGRDFDEAILAVPPPVQEEICAPLRVNGRYAHALRNSSTVVTQAVQLWLDRPPTSAEAGDGLGWRWDPNSLMSMYVEPIDTYCDMSHLLAAEDWPKDTVGHVAYFCGVIPTGEVRTDAQAARRVRRYAGRFLEQDVGRLWPHAATRAAGTGFDWDRLVAPEGVTGRDRLDAQYLRVNRQASERYVLTLADSVDDRLWPGERCFANLVFAGDWTRNGFDAGCVEGAVTSGMLAAQAICGRPQDDAIAALHGPTGFPNTTLPQRGERLLEALGHDVLQIAGRVVSRFVRVGSSLLRVRQADGGASAQGTSTESSVGESRATT
jgi:uncharacterized protein with NAD-binding domain and iron-sulfur cluster